MNRTEATKSLASTDGFFRQWMPYAQRVALTHALQGEEGNYFADLLTALKKRIENMPSTGDTDGQGNNAIVHLHYFRGSIDAWITEKDMGDAITGDERQIQAFGKMCLTGDKNDAEWGYISIEELVENGIELDLYWNARPIREV